MRRSVLYLQTGILVKYLHLQRMCCIFRSTNHLLMHLLRTGTFVLLWPSILLHSLYFFDNVVELFYGYDRQVFSNRFFRNQLRSDNTYRKMFIYSQLVIWYKKESFVCKCCTGIFLVVWPFTYCKIVMA
ncbi:hypothetical protein IQ13_3908 [Lacibacter cauensis]|uniref:Uncharacterized protein n=1 Tax=Lacibacter cauensis TaxID=510947 RepID=A0A562SEM5_9BACT|nr:hypothetical protein IQ13_3908 [Lacibacter cauensis]